MLLAMCSGQEALHCFHDPLFPRSVPSPQLGLTPLQADQTLVFQQIFPHFLTWYGQSEPTQPNYTPFLIGGGDAAAAADQEMTADTFEYWLDFSVVYPNGREGKATIQYEYASLADLSADVMLPGRSKISFKLTR